MWETEFIEVFFTLGLVVNALLFIPQAVKLYRAKSAENISLITFFGFCLIQLFTVLHASIHRDYLLMLGTLCALITCGIVTGLIIYYGYIKQT